MGFEPIISAVTGQDLRLADPGTKFGGDIETRTLGPDLARVWCCPAAIPNLSGGKGGIRTHNRRAYETRHLPVDSTLLLFGGG